MWSTRPLGTDQVSATVIKHLLIYAHNVSWLSAYRGTQPTIHKVRGHVDAE